MPIIRKLTRDEEQKPYAEYFSRPITAAEPAEYEKISQPMDPALAIYPDNIDRLLDEAAIEPGTGWCVLPDGSGYVSVQNKMPGVTLDMISWWFAWHGFEDLRYMLWYAPCHFGVEILSGRERILDKNVPMREKMYGVVHRVKEDVSGKAETVPDGFDIHFRSPEEMGFTPEKVTDRYYVVGAFPDLGKDITSTGKPAMMCHVYRQTDYGVEMRTRFWMGWGMEKGKAKCYINPGFRMPDFVPKNLAKHCIDEYTNLKFFLPELYKEFGSDPIEE